MSILARLRARLRRPIRLRSVEELDAAMREHVETNRYVDADGTLYEPAVENIPPIEGWGDADGERDAVPRVQ